MADELTDDEKAAKRAATFEKLPDEMKRDPKVRAKFGLPLLGDMVAAVAEPVARVLGIECGSCPGRRRWLNDRTPWRQR